MIVKLRQNFTKMREFSWIVIMLKINYAKNIYRLRNMTIPKWEHWRFSAQTFEVNLKYCSFQYNTIRIINFVVHFPSHGSV